MPSPVLKTGGPSPDHYRPTASIVARPATIDEREVIGVSEKSSGPRRSKFKLISSASTMSLRSADATPKEEQHCPEVVRCTLPAPPTLFDQ